MENTCQKDVVAWFESVRGRSAPKFITGLRGTGKTGQLMLLRDRLRDEGVPEDRILVLDGGAPELRRFPAFDDLLRKILSQLPETGKSYVLVRDASDLPDAAFLLAALARSARVEVIATSAARGLLDEMTDAAPFEVLPPTKPPPYAPAEASSRWNEIFLKDVLAQCHVLEVPLIVRVTGWLSDHLGDMLSLRILANAISPAHRTISPHTACAYLDALEAAHLVERAPRWDFALDEVIKTGYRYYFTDPELRLAHFGPAPQDERRRMAFNRAWLRLRHTGAKIYSTSGNPEVDFVSQSGGTRAYWHVDDDDGTLVRLG